MKKILQVFQQLTFLSLFLSSFCIAQAQYTLCDKWVNCGNSVQLLDPYYKDGVSFTWTGSSKNGKANGHGIATKYVNGEFESQYEGSYKDGIREGKGTFTHADGSIKTGTFINGQLMGKGTMTTDDGYSYEGEFINYRMHGKGVFRWANGTVFDGYMVTDMPYTGKITYYTGDVGYIEKGEIVETLSSSKSNYSPKIGQRVTEYFDEDWNRCQPKDAKFYRLVTYSAPNHPQGVVKDYYISGELQSEQYPIFIDYSDEGKNFLEGEQTFFYKNGQVEGKQYYYNNTINGPVESFYDNGAIASKVDFFMGVPNGDMITYYPDGNIQTVKKYSYGQLLNNKYLLLTEDNDVFLVYDEDFEKNSEKWNSSGQSGIIQVNNSYSISLQASPERTISGGIYTGFSPMSENMISIDTYQQIAGQAMVSLLFGFKDWDNFCALSIYGQQYQFIYKKNGVSVQCDEWKTSQAITPDINQLKVVNIADKILFYINDELVDQTGRIYYDGSICGISVFNNTDQPAEVDAGQLVIYEAVDPYKIPEEYLPSVTRDPNEWDANGSGFFLDQSGYIATNYHVVDGAKAIQATFNRNGKSESYPATVVVADKQNDLAIIKIDDPNYTDVPMLPYGLLTRTQDTGSEVFAMGYPIADVMGTEVKFTDGKISSKSGIGGDIRVYQITVPVQNGNSGGPLFDMSGNIIGITSERLNKDLFKSENVNYAIKASYLRSLIDACPEQINILEKNNDVSTNMSLTDRIKKYEDYVVLIRVKLNNNSNYRYRFK